MCDWSRMAGPRHRARIDDRLHPLLRKGRTLSQRRLDKPTPDRMTYGVAQLQEADVNQALTDFSMGGSVSGLAWSLNPYAGCTHACTYCYVPDTMKAERSRWGTYAIVKRNLPTLLAHEMSSKDRRTVYLSTSTDPYQPVEAEQKLTRACLEVLARHDWPLQVLTRGPLVTRDAGLLATFSQCEVGMSVPTLDDDLRAIIEPRAPPIAARLKALRTLADAGITTYANYTPACPFTGGTSPTSVARAFADAGVQWVNSTPWQRLPSVASAVAAAVRGTAYEGLAGWAADRRAQRRTQASLRRALARHGLDGGPAFFNAPWIPGEPVGEARPAGSFAAQASLDDGSPASSM